MISYEEALERWAKKNHPTLADRDVTNISVRHNESWTDDDSGTHWEAITIVTVRTRKIGSKGQKHYKTFEVYATGGDPLVFAQELFEVADEAEREGLFEYGISDSFDLVVPCRSEKDADNQLSHLDWWYKVRRLTLNSDWERVE